MNMGNEFQVTVERTAMARFTAWRLRWLAVGQVVIFGYGLIGIGAVYTLGMDDRWECWVIMPIPNIAIFLLLTWGRWVVAESPNAEICSGTGSAAAQHEKGPSES